MKHHTDACLQWCGGDMTAVLSALVAMISREDARDEDSIGGTENAVFALGVIATSSAFRSLPQLAQVTQMWLQSLPLKEDELEAKYSALQLTEAIEKWDGSVVGGDSCANLAQVLRIAAELMVDAGKKKDDDEFALAHPSVLQRLSVCVKGISSGANGVSEAVLKGAYGQLEAEHQQALAQVC
jgi:hypothetical protein